MSVRKRKIVAVAAAVVSVAAVSGGYWGWRKTRRVWVALHAPERVRRGETFSVWARVFNDSPRSFEFMDVECPGPWVQWQPSSPLLQVPGDRNVACLHNGSRRRQVPPDGILDRTIPLTLSGEAPLGRLRFSVRVYPLLEGGSELVSEATEIVVVD